jgi:hypothetical protein
MGLLFQLGPCCIRIFHFQTKGLKFSSFFFFFLGWGVLSFHLYHDEITQVLTVLFFFDYYYSLTTMGSLPEVLLVCSSLYTEEVGISSSIY